MGLVLTSAAQQAERVHLSSQDAFERAKQDKKPNSKMHDLGHGTHGLMYAVHVQA